MRALLVSAGDVTHVQLAVDGRWEDALRITKADYPDNVETLTTLLRARGEFAVEVFAADANGCQTFVGARFIDWHRDAAAALVRELCRGVFSSSSDARDTKGLDEATAILAAHARGPLFVEHPTRIEVGVVDAWASLGAIDVTPVGALSDVTTARAALLNAAERLRPPPGRIVACECASDSPIPHWVAVEIARSTRLGVTLSASTAKILQWIAAAP